MEIEHEESDSKGRYFVRIEGLPDKAELTYSKAGETMIIIDHTSVPDAFRGQGVGAQLVERVVKDARALGKRIMPLCPFAQSQINRHPHWQDVIKGANP